MKILQGAGVLFAVSALGACHTQPRTAPTPQSVASAPRVFVHARVTGGQTFRMVSSDFAAEQNAYLLVATVGPDARVHVLFPENAQMTGFVSAGTQFDLPPFSPDFDAAPAFWRPVSFNVGAQMDSYDGSGTSFLFVISSAQPLNFSGIAENDGTWDSFLLPGYWSGNDPRRSIEEFASLVGAGSPYRLAFASNLARNLAGSRWTSYGDRMMDCADAAYSFDAVSGAIGLLTPWVWNYIGYATGGWAFYDDNAGMACVHRYPQPTVYAFASLPAVTLPFTPQPREYVGLKVFHHPLVSDAVDPRREFATLTELHRPLVASRSSDVPAGGSSGPGIVTIPTSPSQGGGGGQWPGATITAPRTPTILTRSAPETHTTTTLTPVSPTIIRSAPTETHSAPTVTQATTYTRPAPAVTRATPAQNTPPTPHQQR